MARDYEPWEMEDETRAALNTAMREGTYHMGEVRSPADIQRLEGHYGRQTLTAQLAGTTDKSTREWKNARDNLSRWRSGRRSISATSSSKVASGVRFMAGTQYRGVGSLHVALTATVITSRTSWQGKMAAHLTGPDLEDYLKACEADDWEQAAMIVAEAYGLDPEYVIGLEDVHGFTATPPADDDE